MSKKLIIAAIFIFLLQFTSKEVVAYHDQFNTAQRNIIDQYCSNITENLINRILQEVKTNPTAISELPECFKLNRRLIIKTVLIDPEQFQDASPILKKDKNFIRRLLKINSTILQYVSPKLRQDKAFMKQATYINRDALQYADPRLLDNKLFMKKMIDIDSRNYMFVSNRLRKIPEFAELAFEDDGMLLEYAPAEITANKKIVKIAFISNNLAIQFAAKKLQKDPDFKIKQKEQDLLSKKHLSKEYLTRFLHKYYIEKKDKKNLGSSINNQARFFPNNQIFSRNYIMKWQRSFAPNPLHKTHDIRLMTADSRNYPISWKEDLKSYDGLVKKIEKFFRNHNIDQNTIDNLSATFLWKIKDEPLTLAFNLYLLRESLDIDLGPSFSNVTSLTAVVQKRQGKWEMTVIEVIFDREIKTKVNYDNGHKKYILWDLYTVGEKDLNPKIIFKVEDEFKNYFKVYEEETGGKYETIHHIESL